MMLIVASLFVSRNKYTQLSGDDSITPGEINSRGAFELLDICWAIIYRTSLDCLCASLSLCVTFFPSLQKLISDDIVG